MNEEISPKKSFICITPGTPHSNHPHMPLILRPHTPLGHLYRCTTLYLLSGTTGIDQSTVHLTITFTICRHDTSSVLIPIK